MGEDGLEAWIRSRIPGVPDEFLPYLLRGRGGPVDPWGLVARGEAALRRALETPGRVRSAAFDLLVADAFLTWACEAMAEEADVGSGLERMVEALGDSLAR
jgi:hypothetical protein